MIEIVTTPEIGRLATALERDAPREIRHALDRVASSLEDVVARSLAELLPGLEARVASPGGDVVARVRAEPVAGIRPEDAEAVGDLVAVGDAPRRGPYFVRRSSTAGGGLAVYRRAGRARSPIVAVFLLEPRRIVDERVGAALRAAGERWPDLAGREWRRAFDRAWRRA